MRTPRSIRRPEDFRRCLTSGSRRRAGSLSISVLAHPGSPPRLGLAVKGRRAIDRNRMKRRLRAAWAQLEARPEADVVISTPVGGRERPFQELVNTLDSALRAP